MKSKSFLMAMLLVIAMSASFTSCTKEETLDVPQDVTFTLDYTFVESGSMSRATGTEVYNEFYEKYIKTKVLTPTSYSLTFTNKATGATATMEGCWDKTEGIRLVEGEYEVKGVSQPITRNTTPSDTVYLSFEENISISKDMDRLLLTAKYDSYLLMLDASNYKEAHFNHYSSNNSNPDIKKPLYKADNLLTLFIRDFNYGSSYNSMIPKLILTRKDNHSIEVPLNKIPFEKGKYYYFDDMTNSFDLPPMESGN